MSKRVQPNGAFGKPDKIRKITATDLTRLQKVAGAVDVARERMDDAIAAANVAKAAYDLAFLPAARLADSLRKTYRLRAHEEIEIETGIIRPIPPKPA